MGQTTIRLETEVRDQLKTFGAKGETYNDIVRKLMGAAELQRMQAEARDMIRNPDKYTFYPLEDL